VALIVLLGLFPRPLLTLVDGSVKTLQRVGSHVATENVTPAVEPGLKRLGVRELAAPRTEAVR
jgi:hypothetical protein